jgi:dCTP deaminase
MVQPSSVDVRLDKFFRLFDNHKYPFIDPAEDQPELTRLIEVEADDPTSLRPAPRRVRARLHPRDRHAARRPGRARRGQVLARPPRPAHPRDRRLRRPGLLRARHARALQRRDPADQALARDEDRPALLLPLSSPSRTLTAAAYGSHYQGQRGPTQAAPSRTSTAPTSGRSTRTGCTSMPRVTATSPTPYSRPWISPTSPSTARTPQASGPRSARTLAGQRPVESRIPRAPGSTAA